MIWPLLLMWLAHLGDIVSTYVGLGRGCQELNPAFKVAGFVGLVGLKLVFCIAITLIVHYTYYRRAKVKEAWVQVGTATLIGAGAVVWNVFQIPYCWH